MHAPRRAAPRCAALTAVAQEYTERAAEDRQRFDREMAEYRAQHPEASVPASGSPAATPSTAAAPPARAALAQHVPAAFATAPRLHHPAPVPDEDFGATSSYMMGHASPLAPLGLPMAMPSASAGHVAPPYGTLGGMGARLPAPPSAYARPSAVALHVTPDTPPLMPPYSAAHARALPPHDADHVASTSIPARQPEEYWNLDTDRL